MFMTVIYKNESLNINQIFRGNTVNYVLLTKKSIW